MYNFCIKHNSVIVCDEITYVLDIVSTNITNTIAINSTSPMSISCHTKNVRYKIDCILPAFLLIVKVLFIITFICHYYTITQMPKKKKILVH